MGLPLAAPSEPFVSLHFPLHCGPWDRWASAFLCREVLFSAGYSKLVAVQGYELKLSRELFEFADGGRLLPPFEVAEEVFLDEVPLCASIPYRRAPRGEGFGEATLVPPMDEPPLLLAPPTK